MTRDEQLKLQAWLDGELPESERQAWAVRWAEDPQAQALLEELRLVQGTLRRFDEGQLRVPETREFYWSRIARAIEAGAGPAPAPAPVTRGLWQWLLEWKRWLAPAAVLASLAVVLTLSLPGHGQSDYPEVHVSQADNYATTYRDDERLLTLVWFSYPPESP
ncbi:anti-sigma factor family protein [Limisphaera sp. VF-2]|jgi:negative regulator of sigma E activity|uniref:anti-sigma factor n=1 Tax=Limisphaera sp. VF-2 TaxID=3400418 RepID=UPI00175372C1